MSDIINDSIIIFRKFEEIYNDSVYETLKTPCSQIQKIITEILDRKAEDFHLRKKNSVYDTKFYSIKNRIKDPDSFYEKLIRKGLGLKLMKALEINSTNEEILENKTHEIVSKMHRLDDIIGFRVVTELKNDCKNVYDLLLNNISFFKSKQILFLDLEQQPQTMRNGLEIYRIKGVFQNMYGFELQIKSKIDEAWGDLDHTLFYKDYSISPIKDTVQLTMNNVGELLDKIEKLLFDLRESGGNYEERALHLQEQKILEDELGYLLKAKLGVAYSLKEISSHLSFFKEKLNIKEKKLDNITFEFLEYEVTEEIVDSYVRIRNNSYILIILESIYINWWQLKNGPVIQENINTILNEYIQLLGEFVHLELSEIFSSDFTDYYNSLILNSCSPRIFLDIKKHSNVKSILDKIDGISVDMPDAGFTSDKLKELLGIHYFEGDTDSIINNLLAESDIADVLLEVKGVFSPISNSQANQQINDLLTSLLAKVETLMR